MIDRVSIHAPVKGRPQRGMRARRVTSFNPRPREGATMLTKTCGCAEEVSIHAPVKGRL